MVIEYISGKPDSFWMITSGKKNGSREVASPDFLFFNRQVIPLQEKCHDSDYDKYYYEPSRDFHRKPCYAPCTQYIGDQRQYKENYRKIDETCHG
jgi:hypothetical protein